MEIVDPKPARPIKSNVTAALKVETVMWLRSFVAREGVTQSDVIELALTELRQKEEPGR